MIAETAIEDAAQQTSLVQAIKAAVMQIDVTVSRVYLAQPRWLIKSSSGKPSRQVNRDRAVLELAGA